MELMTKQEALQYLQDVLDVIPSEVPDLTDQSLPFDTKLSFLERIIRAFLEREPFQSIYLMSHDVNSRRRPNWDEIKRDLLLGRGGLCYWLNTFMYVLLSVIGLDASMTYSTYDVGIYSPDNHLIVLVHSLQTPGSLHLVDVGMGCYIPRAVSLDFEKESPEYTDSFMTYKFARESSDAIYLMKKIVQEIPPSAVHKEQSQPGVTANNNTESDSKKTNNSSQVDNSLSDGKTDPTNQETIGLLNGIKQIENTQQVTWQKMYVFNPLVALKTLEPFFHCFDINFTDVTKLSTHSSPRAMCWRGGRFVALVNSKYIEEDDNGKLKKTNVIDFTVQRPPACKDGGSSAVVNEQKASSRVIDKSEIINNSSSCEVSNCEVVEKTEDAKEIPLLQLEPLVEAYGKYFPQFPTQMVRDALKNWLLTGTIFPVPQHFA